MGAGDGPLVAARVNDSGHRADFVGELGCAQCDDLESGDGTSREGREFEGSLRTLHRSTVHVGAAQAPLARRLSPKLAKNREESRRIRPLGAPEFACGKGLLRLCSSNSLSTARGRALSFTPCADSFRIMPHVAGTLFRARSMFWTSVDTAQWS